MCNLIKTREHSSAHYPLSSRFSPTHKTWYLGMRLVPLRCLLALIHYFLSLLVSAAVIFMFSILSFSLCIKLFFMLILKTSPPILNRNWSKPHSIQFYYPHFSTNGRCCCFVSNNELVLWFNLSNDLLKGFGSLTKTFKFICSVYLSPSSIG